ncbi:MAG: glycosyltransferase family 4 protein, partial [Halomonas sp.]|nr:glycosyltransferase family 4 protein [Halomonas sp.]
PGLASQFGELPVEVLPWSEGTEAEAIAGFDIGIMPLPGGPWERGKCGYKLIQYMACGKPVVASAVGVNVEIVEDWQCGALADESSRWHQALSALLVDTERRQVLGRHGRQAVEQHYSLQAQAPRLADILRRAVREG